MKITGIPVMICYLMSAVFCLVLINKQRSVLEETTTFYCTRVGHVILVTIGIIATVVVLVCMCLFVCQTSGKFWKIGWLKLS